MLRHGIQAMLALVVSCVMGCGGNVTTGTGVGGATTTGPSSSHSSTSTSGTTSTTSTGGSTTTSSSSGTTTTASSTSSTSSGGNCDPSKCMPGFICCGGACVNAQNDIFNCGTCGKACTGSVPYCHKGTCTTPTPMCTGPVCDPPGFCCGSTCCGPGELCCDIYGPVQSGVPQCTMPMNGTCPGGCTACQCASPDTPIATPTGDRPIADLAAGDLVYSVDHGAIVAVPILRTNRTPQRNHHVVRVRLASGAVLEVSPRHPTADGRTFGDLHAGDTLDRTAITSAELVPYEHPFTYDILPASETHTYFAAGALIGTTLAP